MLYTAKEIAEKYSTETIKITENNVWKWSTKGLKHVRGPHNRFLYKTEWVDNFLEEQAEKNANKNMVTDFEIKNIRTKKMKRYDFSECKVI